MDILEIIRKRRSVRTFDGKALAPEDAEKIAQFAASAANPYGIQIEWKVLDAKKYGLSSPVIVGEDTYITGKLPRIPHAEEAFGFSFEKIVLFAESIGLGTTWIAGTMNRGNFERAAQLGPGEVMPCVSPLGYPAKKMSVRETMMRRGVRADVRYGFEELFTENGFDSPLTKEKTGILKDALEAVRLAPSAVNRQPWRVVVAGDRVHFYEKRTGGYVSGDGWDLQKIDLGIAMCHFELAAKECGLDVSFELADPGISLPVNTIYIGSYTVKR